MVGILIGEGTRLWILSKTCKDHPHNKRQQSNAIAICTKILQKPGNQNHRLRLMLPWVSNWDKIIQGTIHSKQDWGLGKRPSVAFEVHTRWSSSSILSVQQRIMLNLQIDGPISKEQCQIWVNYSTHWKTPSEINWFPLSYRTRGN